MNWQNKRKKPLGLYVHIPFCVKKCAYCDFLSMPASDEVKKQYTNAVLDEIEDYRQYVKEYQVQTIYFGGGTPSLLPAEYIQDILHLYIDLLKKKVTLFHKFIIKKDWLYFKPIIKLYLYN